MIPVLLVEELAEYIEQTITSSKYAAELQDEKKVTVYRQHISDEDFANDTYYPLISVSLQHVDDGESREIPESYATVGITFGCYGEDKNAWMDVLDLMETVRQAILKKRTIAKRFRLTLPSKWETIENQPYPFWFAYATLRYTIAQPREEMEV